MTQEQFETVKQYLIEGHPFGSYALMDTPGHEGNRLSDGTAYCVGHYLNLRMCGDAHDWTNGIQSILPSGEAGVGELIHLNNRTPSDQRTIKPIEFLESQVEPEPSPEAVAEMVESVT